jgi:hypothetical protein
VSHAAVPTGAKFPELKVPSSCPHPWECSICPEVTGEKSPLPNKNLGNLSVMTTEWGRFFPDQTVAPSLSVLEEEVPTSSASWSGTLTSLLNTPLRSRL